MTYILKMWKLFSNYHALGRIVYDKSESEIYQYLQTGEFPKIAKNMPEPPPVYERKNQTYAPQGEPTYPQQPTYTQQPAPTITATYPNGDAGTLYYPQPQNNTFTPVPDDVYAAVNTPAPIQTQVPQPIQTPVVQPAQAPVANLLRTWHGGQPY